MRATPSRLLVLVGLALTFALAFAPAAFAAAPAITAVTPVDGARVTGGFTLTFSATDVHAVDGAHASVSVGSAIFTPAVSYGGYWDGDGCDTWWVEDRTAASFSCVVPDPGPGVHTVTIRVPDAAGEVATRTQTITRTAALAFADPRPVPGGRYTAASDLSLTVTGAAIAPSTAVVLVDGVAVAATCEVVAPGVARLSADHPFTGGAHTVSVSVGDGTSAPPAMTSWTFTVDPSASPPAISSIQPADGATVQGPFQLVYHVTDVNGVNGSAARVFASGEVYQASVTYAGYWADDGCETWWAEDRTQADLTFSIPDLPPGAHTMRLEVADAAGNWTVRTTTLLRSATLTAGAHTPPASSHNRTVDRVSVTLVGPADASTVGMTIDGVPVPAVVTASGDGSVVSYVSPLIEGTHLVRVSASDGAGSPPMSTEWSFVVDATAPRVASVSPSADSTVTLADGGVALRLEEGDAIDSASVTLTIDGAVRETSRVADAAGMWVRWSGILSEGTHEASITARDLAGNETVHAWSFAVADPPRFSVVAPSGAPVPGTVLLSASVYDVNAELATDARVVVDGADVASTFAANGSQNAIVYANLSGLTNGQHTALVIVHDVAGNEAWKAWTFTVDAVGPALTARAPAASAVLGSHSVALTGTFTDASAIDPATVEAWLDGAPVPIQAVNATQWVGYGCDAYEAVVPEVVHVRGTFNLHDGPHTIRLRAVDAFGQATAEEWSFTVAESPKITNVTPAVGFHTMEPEVTVSATVADFDGIAEATVAWRRAGETAWTDAASTFDTATGRLSAPFVFPDGETGYEFRISARDAGGAVTTSMTSAYADGAAPVADSAATRPAAGSTLTGRVVSFGARFTDSSTIDPARTAAWIDGQPVAIAAYHETQWVGYGCDAYEQEIVTTLVVSGSAELHDGSHTLRVSVSDVFGFQTQQEWSFTVAESPKITAIVPVAGSRTTAESTIVSAKVADYDGVAAATIWWREANEGRPVGEWHDAGATYDSASGALASTFAFPRNDTRYEFRVDGTDSGGLVASATTSIFVASEAAHIEVGTDCTTCHASALETHPMTDCTACHGSPGGPCDCHGWSVHPASWLTAQSFWDHGGPYTGRTCTDCHSHATDVDAQRHASGLAPECAECHEQALTAEHARLLPDGQPFGCSTCHDSVDPGVIAAIAESRTECAACHGLSDGGHSEMHVGVMTSGIVPVFDAHESGPTNRVVPCAMCHASTQLITVHGNRCDVCHSGAAPADSFDTWNRTCRQGACHPTIDHSRAYEAHEAIANADDCFACHAPDWTVSTSACDACHDPATAAPVTTSDIVPAYVGFAPIALRAPGVAWTFYRLDGGAVVSGDSITVAGPSSGSAVHTIEFWSVSDAGAEESPHRTATFTVHADTLPPTTTSNAVASYIGPATVALSATDNGTLPVLSTYWRIDGGETFSGVTAVVPQPESGTAVRTLEFWSVDASGNEETPHRTASMSITADTVAPTTTSNAPAYDRTTAGLRVQFTATDPAPSSGIAATYRRLDGGTAVAGTVLYIYGQGVHTIEYWSVDRAGNIETVRTQTVVKDWTAPVTTSNAQPSYTGPASIHLTGTDLLAGVATTYYRLDGGPQTVGTDVTVTSGGTHTLEFWSVDRAGNSETPHKTVTFTCGSP